MLLPQMRSLYRSGAATARTAAMTTKTMTSAGTVTTQGLERIAMKTSESTTAMTIMRRGPE